MGVGGRNNKKRQAETERGVGFRQTTDREEWGRDRTERREGYRQAKTDREEWGRDRQSKQTERREEFRQTADREEWGRDRRSKQTGEWGSVRQQRYREYRVGRRQKQLSDRDKAGETQTDGDIES